MFWKAPFAVNPVGVVEFETPSFVSSSPITKSDPPPVRLKFLLAIPVSIRS